MAADSRATESTATRLHIVALGSSFAAGPGIQPQSLKIAGRSQRNYAGLLAARLGARLTDLTVSGATLKNVLSEPQVLFRNHFAPQLSAFPPDVDVVTITGGGNDLQYIAGMTQAAIRSSLIGRFISWFLPLTSNEEPLTAEAVAERFIAIIDKIRETSPQCQILLVEYLTLLGPDIHPGVDVPLESAEIKRSQNIANELQKAYALAAEARGGCKVIPAADMSRDHGIGSDEPWVQGFSYRLLLARVAPFHPNLKGMEAVSEMLYQELRSNDSVMIN
ncbi:hypothetical protein BP6252_03970 [Coleophoma cylindrospora]|uniref:SGNH hydrolase-type esterase domain-containing protein n=1 Tax=Coleophoma cylindrospora TaxID=1849047 RepID=A0A3D8SAP1_9HELO|nr:hypothetical protein BP6252_03970 [Coleophoma cylindrospora]